MLERFKLLLKVQQGKAKIYHIALTMQGMEKWSEEKKKPLQESYQKSFEVLKEVIAQQIQAKIPILSVYVLPEQLKKEEEFSLFLDELIVFLQGIKHSPLIHENNVKISALGKWYDVPGRAVDSIKEIIDETKDYDRFYVNLHINYNGREEITDACRLIGRQIKVGRLDVEGITKDTIKENLYTSYFLPPDLIIKNGKIPQVTTFLLWDMPYAIFHFTEKYFPDFTASDFAKALEFYNKHKKK